MLLKMIRHTLFAAAVVAALGFAYQVLAAKATDGSSAARVVAFAERE